VVVVLDDEVDRSAVVEVDDEVDRDEVAILL